MAKKKKQKQKRQKRHARDLPNDFEINDLDLSDLHNVTESRALLRYLTRLLFVSVLLSCAVVMATSLLLLFRCRRQVKGMEEIVDCNHGHCSSQSLPAYFSLLVLFVAIFGLGCVGRRVTGALLVVVSLAAVVVAAATALTQDCMDDVVSVKDSLVHKLQQCGLYQTVVKTNITHDHAFQFHRFHEVPASYHTPQCQDVAINFDAVCRESVAAGKPLNETTLDECVVEIAAILHELCTQDTEVVLPVLITVPIFYVFIGIGFIIVKHTDNTMVLTRRSSGTGGAVKCQGTNTKRPSLDSSFSRTGPACRRWLASCLEAVFTRSPLCFSCFVRGYQCRCCPSVIFRSTSSRQSFTHMHEQEQAEAETDAALHMPLRTSVTQDRQYRMYLMEQEQCV